ncbi:MAG TPA: glycosyltransferase family 2 protein [Actinopolymorphaceae bacterium]
MTHTPPSPAPSPKPSPGGYPPLRTGGHWPSVSAIMPILDEEDHLADAVARVFGQDYPGDLEVVLACGPSNDRTDAIAAVLASGEPRLTVVANPTGATPAGLNVAIAAARHEVIVRVDGHGLLSDGYIRRAVELLDDTRADNVGGVMAAEGTTPFQHAVARAMTSRLGIGGQSFHVGGSPGPVDSVYLGVFRRRMLLDMGGFDETYRRAQDWELNYRIRQRGGTVWFSPELSVTYRPRTSWTAVRRQFFRTGQWRHMVARLNPGTAGLRYLAPPLTTVALAVGTVAGLVGIVASPWLLLGFALPAGYLLLVLIGSLVEGRGLEPAAKAWLPVVVATMHVSWGTGYLLSSRSLAHEGSSGATATRAG